MEDRMDSHPRWELQSIRQLPFPNHFRYLKRPHTLHVQLPRRPDRYSFQKSELIVGWKPGNRRTEPPPQRRELKLGANCRGQFTYSTRSAMGQAPHKLLDRLDIIGSCGPSYQDRRPGKGAVSETC